MSLRVIAEKDVFDEFRSYTVWVYLFPFVVIFGLGGYVGGRGAAAGIGSSLANSLAGLTLLLVPLAALVVAHEAIARERESGTVRLLLAYPHTRRDVVVGAALGRAILLAGLFLAGDVVAVLAWTLVAGLPELLPWLRLAAVGSLYAASFAVIVVGLSAATRTTWQSLTLTLLALAGFAIAWDAIPGIVRWALNGFAPAPGPAPEWAVAFQQLDPITAFQNAAGDLVSGASATPEPVYASEPFGALVLVAWAALVLGAGLSRFERADL